MMVRPSVIDESTEAQPSPGVRTLRRGGLIMAVLEALAKPLAERPAEKTAAPAPQRKPVNRHERRKEAARLKKQGFTRPGSYVISPDGRKFEILPGEGQDSQGRPVMALQRVDRRFREQKITWRPAAEVETWTRMEIHG